MMTTISRVEQSELLRHAAAQARLAPSVHNTQPWRFRLGSDSLEIRSDPLRQLNALDPDGRQLMISCGCALFNARVALAAERQEVVVDRFPDPSDPQLIARLRLTGGTAPWSPLVRLATAIPLRRSNRREFFERDVPEEVQWELSNAASVEDAVLVPVDTPQARVATARLVQEADSIQNANPDYVAELREWTSNIASRTDGVTAPSFPMTTAERGDVPLRDFGAKVTGLMEPVTDSDTDQCLMLLGTAEDNRFAWLRAGEALERVWLELTRLDYVASLITQVVEVQKTRTLLRSELGLLGFPHVLLRLGQAAPNVPTNRRALNEMLEIVDG